MGTDPSPFDTLDQLANELANLTTKLNTLLTPNRRTTTVAAMTADTGGDNLRQGTHIRTARQTAGLTITQVAEHIGVTEGSIRHWEAGRSSPSLANLIRLSTVLDVSPSELLVMGLTQ